MANFEKSKYDEIESYLNKTMASDRRQKFEEEMKTNKDLANEVRAQEFDRAFEFLSIKADVKEMFVKLKNESKETNQEEAIPTPSMWVVFVRNPYIRTLAASIVIALIGLGVWQVMKDDHTVITDNTDSLKLSPKVSEKINELARLSKQNQKQDTPQELSKAILAFERAEDTSAIRAAAKLFERPRVDPSKPNDSTVFGSNPNNKPIKNNPKTESYRLLYQGLIFLYSGEYDKSISKFNEVHGLLEEDARFYKALAYLKNNNTKAGRELLNEIIKNSENESFRTQAQDLLALLNEKK